MRINISMYNTYKGKFVPTNHKKYKGNFQDITYRSGWEKSFMMHLDHNPKVVKWSSEEVVINYLWSADGKRHRYFMDFYAKYDSGQEFWFEVKPFIQTQEPKCQGKTKKRQLDEALTYSKNRDKWLAAHTLATKMGVKFIILTEVGLRRLGVKI
ncbi:head completion protein [Paraglaciecola Antarctic GD virus 1]|nr:head completion protein [Paraglaciecola Antarctic GD virus 1]